MGRESGGQAATVFKVGGESAGAGEGDDGADLGPAGRGDAATVQAVLRSAWTVMAQGHRIEPGTVRVRYVERVGDRIMAHVFGTNGTGDPDVPESSTYADQVFVSGPDRARLTAVPYSGWSVYDIPKGKPADAPNERVLTPAQPVTGMRDCGRDYVVVLAAPGTTATVQDVTALTPAGRPLRTTLRVPVAPSGLGILRLASPGATITVVRGGRTVVKDKVVPAGAEYKPLTDAQIDAATQGWDPGSLPAGRKQTITGASVGMLSDATYRLPVSDFRTLWLADTGDGMAGLFTWTVPGGARTVVGLKETGPAGKIIAGYGGLLPPGTDLDDAVVAWDTQFQNPVPGLVAVVAAPRGVRAEAVLGGGTVQQVPMTRGGAALPVGTTSVRVYDAAGRLLGTRGIGAGLTQLPEPHR